MKSTLQRIELLLGKVDAQRRQVSLDLAEVKGRIQNLPSNGNMVATVIGSQIALAGMLFAGIRFLSV